MNTKVKSQFSRAAQTDRRLFLASSLGFGGLFFSQRGLFAQELTQTPGMTIGPYYPNRMPLDLDNDLIRINDGLTPAVGKSLG